MQLAPFSIVFCRGIGLALVLLGFCSLLPSFVYGPYPATLKAVKQARQGWTSYAPISQEALRLPPGKVLSIVISANLPAIAQVVCGIVLLVFSRFIGGLLASGLPDHAT